MNNKKLHRSKTNKMIAGICGGLGEYFGMDPTVVRLIAVAAALISGGTAVIIYIVLIFVIPEEAGTTSDSKKT